MACTLNSTVYHKALGAAHAGDVDHGAWTAPGHTAENCIGKDGAEWKYPIFTSAGKLSAKGVSYALGYAETNNESALYGPLQKISDAIKAHSKINASLIYLFTPGAGDFVPLQNLSSAMPKEVAGQPCSYFWKDLIHAGTYIHPVKKFVLPVDTEKLNTLAANFREMKSRGVEVPINVDHSEAADDNRGFLIDVKRENGTLFGLCQFIGNDAATTAARNRVSPGIDNDFDDGEGHKYAGPVLRHIALTPVPVVPDQQPFKIAASRFAADGGDVLTLSAVNNLPLMEIPPMSNTMLPCSDDSLNTLHRHIAGLAPVANDEKMSRVAQHVATTHGHMKNMCQALGMDSGDDSVSMMSRAVTEVQQLHARDVEDAGGAAAVATLSVAQIRDKAKEKRKSAFDAIQSNAELRQRLEDKDKQITTLSAATVKPLDPENEQSLIESATVLFEAAVAKGGINPLVKEKFLSLAKGKEGRANTLILSGAANPAGTGPLILAIARILTENQRPALGTASGLQELSRHAPGDADAAPADPTSKFKQLIGAGAAGTVL
jgi:hypothetical protein